MTEPTLHVAFGLSGAGTLRAAIETDGRKDEVIGLIDNLSFGPVDYPDVQTRVAWLEKELGFEGFGEVVERSEMFFWKNVLVDERRKVLWTSRRSAMDYTGFLECLWRLGDTPCSVVDLTDTMIKRRNRESALMQPGLALCLGMLPESTILENDLLDQAEHLTQEKREYYHAIWKRLRAENAPFRVVGAEGIASAPITYFDELVRSCAITEWRKSARVIGEALARDWPFEYFQTGDLVLFSRLQKLVEMGVLEGRGDMSHMHNGEVRLPS